VGFRPPPQNPKYPTQTLARLGASANFDKKRVFKAFFSDFQTCLRHFSERCPTQIFGAAHVCFYGLGKYNFPALINKTMLIVHWVNYNLENLACFVYTYHKISSWLTLQQNRFPPERQTKASFERQLQEIRPKNRRENKFSPSGSEPGDHNFCRGIVSVL